jgi:hypothetical protein
VRYYELPHLTTAAVYIIARDEPGYGSILFDVGSWGERVPGHFLHFGYVGQTGELGDRHEYGQHHRAFDFMKFGADIALILPVANRIVRCSIETDIRQHYNPPLNRQ